LEVFDRTSQNSQNLWPDSSWDRCHCLHPPFQREDLESHRINQQEGQRKGSENGGGGRGLCPELEKEHRSSMMQTSEGI